MRLRFVLSCITHRPTSRQRLGAALLLAALAATTWSAAAEAGDPCMSDTNGGYSADCVWEDATGDRPPVSLAEAVNETHTCRGYFPASVREAIQASCLATDPGVGTHVSNEVSNEEGGHVLDDVRGLIDDPTKAPMPGLPVPGCEDEYSDPTLCAVRRLSVPPVEGAQLQAASAGMITAVAVDTAAAPGYHHYVFCRFGLGASVFYLSPAAHRPWWYKGGTFLNGCIEVEYFEGFRYTTNTRVDLSTFAQIGREKPVPSYPESCRNPRKEYYDVRFKEHNAGCTFKSRRDTRVFGQMHMTPNNPDLKWLPEEEGVETHRKIYYNCTLLNGRRTLDCFMSRYIK